jgi:hypothetical protein
MMEHLTMGERSRVDIGVSRASQFLLGCVGSNSLHLPHRISLKKVIVSFPHQLPFLKNIYLGKKHQKINTIKHKTTLTPPMRAHVQICPVSTNTVYFTCGL